MISWLQSNLQKHFRFLFIILLVVVIVAFVFTIGAAPGIGDGRQQYENLKFFDTELTTETQRQSFFNAAYYSALLGGAPMNQDQLNQYAFNRAAALHLANEHNIPSPNSEQLTEHIKELGMFMGPDQNFSPEAYARFRDEIRASGQISEGALSQIMADDYRVNKVFEALSSPGFVLESEVIEDLALDETKWSVNVAEFNFSDFEPDIDDSTEKLEAFFANNSFRYTSPARRVIAFVEFKALDHMDDVEPSEDDLKNYHAQHASKYTKTVPAPPPAEGEEEAEPAEPTIEPATFEESKDQIAFDYKLEEARKRGQSRAENLALALVEADNAAGPSNSLSIERIEALIEQQGLETKRTTPFARNERPLGLNWSPNLIALSFQLSESQLFSQPVIEGDSTYVLFLENENPEFVPSFKTVEPRVKEDYAQEEARRLRTVYADELAAAMRETDSESFKSVAESKQMTVKSFSDFKRRDTVEGLDASLIFSLSSLEAGDVSDPSIREENGFIVQVVTKEVPEISTDNEEYEARLNALKLNYERYAVSQYISKLTNDELLRSGLAAN